VAESSVGGYTQGVALTPISQINQALKTLNPNHVREMAERPITLGVLAADDAFAADIFSFLLPSDLSDDRMREAGKRILRVAEEADFERATLGLSEPGVPHPAHFYRFDRRDLDKVVRQILKAHPEDALALSRWFPAFRGQAIEKIIWKVSRENALFTVTTAMPNVVPSVISLPWAAGEFASDTAFLTMNQVRMAFLIAAASDADVGYGDQKGQITSIVAAAFGWRGLARQLVGKIPAGGGLVSKGLVSFAGTYAVGKSLEKFAQHGSHLTRAERKHHYGEAYERGRGVVEAIVDRLLRRERDAGAAPLTSHA